MRIIFMGTPEFAATHLQMLIDEKYDVITVITQPDRPKGRGNKLTPPPVKELALKYNIPVYQPEKIKAEEATQYIENLNPDLIVVVAFGQLLSKRILDIPSKGCINVHGSLLPKYRGAAPIQWAILNGEKETGVTTMYMDVGMDTGDMILKRIMNIREEDTFETLHDRMKHEGAIALKETLNLIENNNIVRENQQDAEATYAAILDKNIGKIDWNKETEQILNQIRGLNPWPTAYTFYNNEMLKIWSAESINIEEIEEMVEGQIVDVIPQKGIVVRTKNGYLLIKELQVQGGKRMGTPEYLKGHSISKNIVLGEGYSERTN